MNSEDQYQEEYRRLAATVHQTIRGEFPNYLDRLVEWHRSAVTLNSRVVIAITPHQDRFYRWLSSVPQIRLTARYSLGSLETPILSEGEGRFHSARKAQGGSNASPESEGTI